ncbi:hypothetical protein ACIPRI_15985 [Variovorax sp. LARHSF232]
MLRPSDLDAIDAPRVALTRMTATGLLEKVGPGLLLFTACPSAKAPSKSAWWRLPPRSPRQLFCLLTALQLHALTTQLPRQVWICHARRQPCAEDRLSARRDGPDFG